LFRSWKERIENFSFYSKDFGDWHTQNATQLTIFTNTIQLNPICLQSNYKKLCANFMWRKKYGINGKIFLNTDDIRWIANLIPKTDDAKGLLNINLDISGHFKKPIILGHVKLTNASINVPDYNTSIKNIMIIGQGDARGTIDWKGSALVGNNSVYMTGKSFLNQNGYPTKLMIHGDQLTLTNSQSYKIIASPELNLSYIDHVFVLKGAVLINKALIQTNEFEGDSVTLADDIVFIDTKNQEKKSVIQFQSHLNINLGDNAFINIEGINGQVVGKILLHYDPRDMTTAKGEINIVNGQFSAYGRKLKIDKGKLLFTGGKINNPYVDLIASKVVHTSTRANVTLGAGFLTSLGLAQSGEVLVGVNIKGRLKNYQVKLFSQPGGFSDADILSLMLFDRTTNQVTSVKGGQALLNAASQLNLVGGGLTSVTEELQNAFDLEELGLSNESLYNPSTNAVMINPSFTIGKRIGHNLHVSYSIGIFDPISIIRLRYDITPNWNVQTDASVLGRGFDVFYTIER
ncbi:MAG: translocation/assembly module TamB domain-containing protein, partial [Gammaproteobacteria bacterium]